MIRVRYPNDAGERYAFFEGLDLRLLVLFRGLVQERIDRGHGPLDLRVSLASFHDRAIGWRHVRELLWSERRGKIASAL